MFRSTDPDTSIAAASSVMTEIGKDKVLKALKQYPGGLTDFELADETGWQQTSIGKRRGELRDVGLVIDSGYRKPAPSGRMAIVWCLTKNNNYCNVV